MEKQGKPTPLREMPSTSITSDWYLKLFTLLSNARTGSYFGFEKLIYFPNPIQISEIKIIYDTFEISDSFEEFLEIMQTLDKEYINLINARNSDSGKRHG